MTRLPPSHCDVADNDEITEHRTRQLSQRLLMFHYQERQHLNKPNTQIRLAAFNKVVVVVVVVARHPDPRASAQCQTQCRDKEGGEYQRTSQPYHLDAAVESSS